MLIHPERQRSTRGTARLSNDRPIYAGGLKEGAGDPPHRDRDHDVSRRDPDPWLGRDPRAILPAGRTISFLKSAGSVSLGRRCVGTSFEAAGLPEVKGVWSHAACGSRPLWLTVPPAIKQMYAGHSKPVPG